MYLSMAAETRYPPKRSEYAGRSVPPPPSENRTGARETIIGLLSRVLAAWPRGRRGLRGIRSRRSALLRRTRAGARRRRESAARRRDRAALPRGGQGSPR